MVWKRSCLRLAIHILKLFAVSSLSRRKEFNFFSIPAYMRTTKSAWCCVGSLDSKFRHVSWPALTRVGSFTISNRSCGLMSAYVAYADWSPLPTAPSRKGILENKHRRSWQSGCLPEMNWRIIRCVLWFGSRFGGGPVSFQRQRTKLSSWSFLQSFSLPDIVTSKIQANHNKNKQVWWPEIKVAN